MVEVDHHHQRDILKKKFISRPVYDVGRHLETSFYDISQLILSQNSNKRAYYYFLK